MTTAPAPVAGTDTAPAGTDQDAAEPAGPTDLADLVDLERYPVHRPHSPRWEEAVAEARAGLADLGAAELPGFLTPQGVAAAVADAVELEAVGHRNAGPATAYLELPDPDLPVGHARRWLGRASVAAIAYDLFPASSPTRRLYESEAVRAFVEAILDRGPLHRYADPLGGLNLASMEAGDELQWHFDQTDFVVSIALRDADEGGDFEVVPRIRTGGDERYDDVRAVLEGDRSGVVTLPMVPGTLLVFEGRWSLHRVSPIAGPVSRLVALLGYDTKPGTMSSDLLKQLRYGRTEPVAAR